MKWAWLPVPRRPQGSRCGAGGWTASFSRRRWRETARYTSSAKPARHSCCGPEGNKRFWPGTSSTNAFWHRRRSRAAESSCGGTEFCLPLARCKNSVSSQCDTLLVMLRCSVISLVWLCATAAAADWPQWRGPNRDGVSQETGLLQAWPGGGPKQVWKAQGLGEGYSSFAVVGNRLYTQGQLIATPVRWRNRVYIANGQDPESGPGPGHLYAIDATKRGDITESGRVWRYDGMKRSISTAAVAGGLVFAADIAGFLHAMDAETGKPYWTHDTLAVVWGSPMVVGGNVYLGDEDGDVVVLAAAKEKKVIAEMNMEATCTRRWFPRTGP